MKVKVQCGNICRECEGCTGHRDMDGTFHCDPACSCPASVREAQSAPMPLGDQLAAIAPYLEQAAAEVVPTDMDRAAVLSRAVDRFMTIGARDHGDQLFRKDAAELLDEEEAEFSDAIIYRARRLGLTNRRFLIVPNQLTDEEAERIRADWKRKYGAGE